MDLLENLVKEYISQNELDQADRAEMERLASGELQPTLPDALLAEDETPKVVAVDVNQAMVEGMQDIRTALSGMKLPAKIKLAMFGNSVCRSLLIMDTNRMVQQFVLRNPRLRLSEVEEFAKNSSMADNVLRSIADSRDWMKSYSLKYSIVTNPRTPGDVALKWLRYINPPELKKISKSKSIPQLIAVTAKRRLMDMESA